MKIQIKTIAGLLILFFISAFAYSQNGKATSKPATASNSKNDSTELQSLVVKLLKWHQADKRPDFEPLTNSSTDSIYTGINWPSHKKRLTELETTGLFSKGFLDDYQKIAVHLDNELKTNKTKYFVGDMPPYGNETSEWCNCQDYPANIWKRLRITNFQIHDDIANFKWTFGKNFSYSVKAVKENNVWKIGGLERFTVKNFSW